MALRGAKALSITAAARVGDTAEYRRWFGRYSDRNGEIVRANLKALVAAIRGGGVVIRCEAGNQGGCDSRDYAWVYARQAFVLRLCPAFFNLPAMKALQPGEPQSNDGTREGAILHELSHFAQTADTEDHCYSRSECARLATRDPGRAIANADSYQYFAEDVSHYARHPQPSVSGN